MVFRFFESKDRQRRDAQFIGTKAFDTASRDTPLQIVYRRRERKIEKRLLSVAQHLQAPFDAIGTIMKNDRRSG